MSKPKILLSIGYNHFLLPDDTGITTLMKLLSRATPCDDNTYKGEVHLHAKEPRIKVEYLPASTKFLNEDGGPLPTRPLKKARDVKALPDPARNLLEWKP